MIYDSFSQNAPGSPAFHAVVRQYFSILVTVVVFLVSLMILNEGKPLLYNHFLPNNTAPCWFTPTRPNQTKARIPSAGEQDDMHVMFRVYG